MQKNTVFRITKHQETNMRCEGADIASTFLIRPQARAAATFAMKPTRPNCCRALTSSNRPRPTMSKAGSAARSISELCGHSTSASGASS